MDSFTELLGTEAGKAGVPGPGPMHEDSTYEAYTNL